MRPTASREAVRHSKLFRLVVLTAPILSIAGDRPPRWLSPYPGATATDGNSYTTPASMSSVLLHYEHELKAAGIQFTESSFGEGVSIRASTDKISCVVRVGDLDAGARNRGATVSAACAAIAEPALSYQLSPGASSSGVRVVANAPPYPPATTQDNIVALIEHLIKDSAAKPRGEFESTSDYDLRTQALLQKYANRTFNFSLPELAEAFKYDADRERILFWTEARLRASSDGQLLQTIAIRRTVSRPGSYTASNLFGVKKQIDASSVEEDGFAIAKGSEVTAPEVLSPLEFPLSKERAPKLKPVLGLAVAGRLAAPDVHLVIERHNPTMTEPHDSIFLGRYVSLWIEKISVVDVKNGTVIASVQLEHGF